MNRGTSEKKGATNFSLKDDLFNAATVSLLADGFARADASFDKAGFEAEALARFPELELKARIDWLAECLIRRLPEGLENAAPVIRAALPEPLDPTRTDDDFGHFINAPFGVVIERMGLEAHPDLSLDLLHEITKRFSMEFSIRAFINQWPDQCFERFEDWAGDKNYHVRRLVSEGTRPRLPWGSGLTSDPLRPLALLDRLHSDPTRYVTRSVCNHLNDLGRVAPDAVIERLSDWRERGAQEQGELTWMEKHALRGLTKAGHAGALAQLGFSDRPEVTGTLSATPETVEIGNSVKLDMTLTPHRSEPVEVDVVLHNGSSKTGRRYKVKALDLVAGKPQSLKKSIPLKGNATTFRLAQGPCTFELRANGMVLDSTEITLT